MGWIYFADREGVRLWKGLCQGRNVDNVGENAAVNVGVPFRQWICIERLPLKRDLKIMKQRKKNCEAVLLLLQKESGNMLYAIDYFNMGGKPVFYLRMRHKCHTFIGVDAMGECIALSEDGCRLEEDQRPKGGRFLESSPDGHCVQHYTREMMESDWKPYQKILSSIWEEYESRFQKDGTFDRCEEAYFDWMRRERLK